MNTLQLINYIASHPEFETIVLGDSDDLKPMQAIERLSSDIFHNVWRVNGTLEKKVLLCYHVGECYKSDHRFTEHDLREACHLYGMGRYLDSIIQTIKSR